MIVFNTDGSRTLVKVGDWKDMYDRVGFELIVDETEDKLKEVLAQYSLKEKNPCGLKNCRTPHNRGYLVSFESGKETNIGNVCGKKHFGLDFERSKNAFSQAVNAQKYRDAIIEKQYQLDGLTSEIKLQREDIDQNNLYEKMHGFVERILDNVTCLRLKERSRRQAAIVTTTKRAVTEETGLEDFEDKEELQKEQQLAGGRFIEETAFIISGVGAVTSYKRLSRSHYQELLCEIDVFSKLEPDSLDYKALATHYRWMQSIDKKLRNLDEVITDCKRFTNTSNTQQIIQNKSLI